MAHASIDRSRRVGGLIQRELSELIVTELGDPRVDGVTITDVRLAKDLRQAVIFVSRLDEASAPIKNDAPKQGDNKSSKARANSKADVDEHEYVDVLNRAAGVLRRHLGRRLSMKVTPNLNFKYDETLAHGFRISKLIDDSRAADGEGVDSDDASLGDRDR